MVYNIFMNINIKASNLELTDTIKDYINKKIKSIAKLVNADEASLLIEVKVGKRKGHHKAGDAFKAEINFTMSGTYLSMESSRETLYAAIDKVRDEIVAEIKKTKTRKNSLGKKGGRKIKGIIKRA